MKRTCLLLSYLFAILLMSNQANAQLDSTIMLCQKHIQLPFISDGQSYTALLNGDEVAEFYATFYGESTYRLATYSGTSEGNIIFSVYDQERNLLFTNDDFENTPYWDFKFDYTMDCIIEARLDAKYLKSGIAVMLIGFQQ